MWFGYNPLIIFYKLFRSLNLVIFRTFSHLESDVPVGGIVFLLVFFFCSGVSTLFSAQGSPSSGSLLNLLSPRF